MLYLSCHCWNSCQMEKGSLSNALLSPTFVYLNYDLIWLVKTWTTIDEITSENWKIIWLVLSRLLCFEINHLILKGIIHVKGQSINNVSVFPDFWPLAFPPPNCRLLCLWTAPYLVQKGIKKRNGCQVLFKFP